MNIVAVKTTVPFSLLCWGGVITGEVGEEGVGWGDVFSPMGNFSQSFNRGNPKVLCINWSSLTYSMYFFLV
jgi:hypothetical protein